MVSVSDILELLGQWPLWKRITSTPEEIDALRDRVADLERLLEKRSTTACPICRTGLLVVAGVTSHPRLGRAGIQEQHLECDNPACGHKEERVHDPSGDVSGI